MIPHKGSRFRFATVNAIAAEMAQSYDLCVVWSTILLVCQVLAGFSNPIAVANLVNVNSIA